MLAIKAILFTPIVTFSIPKTLKAPTGHPSVSSCVLGIPVAEEVLGCAKVDAIVCEVATTGVPQHVGVNVAEART